MRTTLVIDDALLERARLATGIEDEAAIVHAGLNALVARESALNLAKLGGTQKRARAVRRRNPADE